MIHDTLACQRDAFSLPHDSHYLNCAYMGPLPLRAQEAGIAGIRAKGIPGSITTPDFFRPVDDARALFARIINAPDPQRVAIIPAVSYGIATAARNARCHAGDRIVIAGEQFPSNVYAWRRLARESGAELHTVHAPEDWPRGAAWTDAIVDAIDERTAVVALPIVHWTDGTRFDIERIGRRARDVNAMFVIDGTQSIGAMPFDITAIGADAVICAAYKWLLGPYSLGFAWYGPRFDDGTPIEETWISRDRSEDFQGLIDYRDAYQSGAARYDMGERSNFHLMPVAAESMRMLLEWTSHGIQDYCSRLCQGLIGHAVAKGYRVEPADWRGSHLFGLRLPPSTDLAALHRTLKDAGVHVSLRGTALRVSPNVYNDDRDVAALMRLL